VSQGPEDDALLAAMAAGDRTAADVFVRRHAPSVIGVAFHVLGDRALAEDIAQEAFLRACQAAATYDARRGGVRSWLLAISRNAAIDAARVRRPTPTDPSLVSRMLDEDAETEAPEDGSIAAAEAMEVRRALLKLPPEQCQALLLASVAGRTAAEVADHQGIPLGTAKTRIRAALIKMREALELEAHRAQ
jgi:RNA polymerase sigma-70 factor (ECF subfamily)